MPYLPKLSPAVRLAFALALSPLLRFLRFLSLSPLRLRLPDLLRLLRRLLCAWRTEPQGGSGSRAHGNSQSQARRSECGNSKAGTGIKP